MNITGHTLEQSPKRSKQQSSFCICCGCVDARLEPLLELLPELLDMTALNKGEQRLAQSFGVPRSHELLRADALS